MSLAKTGGLTANLTEYAFDDALKALDDLEAGKIEGRAVIKMN